MLSTSTSTPPAPALGARADAATGPRASSAATVRRVIAVVLATLGGTLALAVGLQALMASTPVACGDDCATTLAQHRFAVVFGVPALAWATALHAVLLITTWGLVLTPRGRPAAILQTAQLGLVVALLGGSATYLVLGLATDVRCKICLAMHALAVVAALGAALGPRAGDLAPWRERIAALVLAAAAWLGLAWGLGQLAARARTPAAAAARADTTTWMAAVCDPRTCPSAAHFGPEALPPDDGALVLGRGAGATLVAWLDLDCAACRADFAAEEPLYRALVQRGGSLRLLLRADDRACDARGKGGDPRACEAPAAVVCAERHAGDEAALDYIAWELSAEPGFYTLADRRDALAALTPMAARCLDSELALGPRGTLAEHAEAARRLAAFADTHAGCADADGADATAWWCFDATPSFAIIHTTPRALRTPSGAAAAPANNGASTPFASATGALRREVLERCLEVP